MRWALGAALLVAACAAQAPRATPAADPRAPREAESRGTCGGCHAAAEAGWAKSMHHASFTSREFQLGLENDPIGFCTDCHAPRQAERGVDCVTCHTNAEAHERAAERGKPRAVAMTTKSCASCHELPNPVAATMLQTTESEHAASAYADVACTMCHDDHEMRVTRNPEFLANALTYGVRESETHVVVSLRSKGVGHRFPTGDLFRALEVHCWIEGADGRIVAETSKMLHRDWDTVRHIPGVAPTSDTRLGEAPIELELPTTSSVGPSTLHIEVDYSRGATARGNVLTRFDTLRIADWRAPLH